VTIPDESRERFRLSNFLSLSAALKREGRVFGGAQDGHVRNRKVDVINNNYSPGVDWVDGMTGRR